MPPAPTVDEELAAAGLPGLPRHAWVEVDLAAIRSNVAQLRELAGPASAVGVVVKADAYGHGIEMAAAAALEGGATTLLVATLDEALRLRAFGIDAPVQLLLPTLAAAVDEAVRAGCILTVGDVPGAEAVVRAAGASRAGTDGHDVEVQLEVDTGMTRGGVLAARAVEVARRLVAAPGVRLVGVWSHVADPGDPAVSGSQARAFESVLRDLAEAGIAPGIRHLASSGGLLLGSSAAYQLTRVGLAAYGVVPDEFLGDRGSGGEGGGSARGLRPALALKARAVRIVDVPPGTRVGYGGEWAAGRPSRVATLPLGYGDGYARASWPGALALVRGRRVPLVGRVSMDSITLDVTDVPGAGPEDEVVLIGPQGDRTIDAVEVARLRGTIAWEVLSSLSARLPRVYRDGGRIVAIRPPGTQAPIRGRGPAEARGPS